MKIIGGPMSMEEQDAIMNQLDDNLAKIDEVLQRDEADQDALLRRKLEERANRRKKMQDKLKQQEQFIEVKTKELEEKKEEIE
jgi:hypothetical protein